MKERGYFFISEKRKIAYLEIPKNGCTSVKNFLLQIENKKLGNQVDKGGLNPNIVHGEDIQQSILNRLPKAELDNDNYFRFTIVRNPYLRLLSFYNSKVLNYWDKSIEPALNKIGIKERMDFNDCVKAILSTDPDKLEYHTALQSSFLTQNGIFIVDMIGKLENSALPFWLLTEIALLRTKIPKYYVLNSSKLLYLLSDDKLRESIYDYYKEDFSLLKYSKDINFCGSKQNDFTDIYLNEDKFSKFLNMNRKKRWRWFSFYGH